jgi:NAD(P)-dependent dehydrogenase (short-subunit alcohol dehydrogenase family)
MSTDLLANRICLITGSSRGIGLGIARALAAQAATVALHGRDENALRKSLASLANKASHSYVAVDLNTAGGPRKLADGFCRLYDKLDVLIHSAGLLGPKTPLASYPEDAWNEVLRINLTAPFLITQALLPVLRKAHNPSVIFISSGVGRKGRADWGAYAVSKFGVEGISQVWSEELQGEGIRVNAVNPGGTRTQMRATAYPQEDPLTLPTPEEISPIFVWLARADSQVTGLSLEARDWIDRDPSL